MGHSKVCLTRLHVTYEVCCCIIDAAISPQVCGVYATKAEYVCNSLVPHSLYLAGRDQAVTDALSSYINSGTDQDRGVLVFSGSDTGCVMCSASYCTYDSALL